MKTFLVTYSTDPPTAEHLGRLGRIRPDVRVLAVGSEAAAIEHAPEAHACLGHRYLWQILPHAKHLEWVQSSAGGVDHLFVPELLVRSPILTRSPIFADVIAWHALSLALALVRDLPAAVRSHVQPDRAPLPLPIPRTAMIFGMGHIGSELGRLLQGLGCRVLAVGRSGRGSPAHCDEFLDAQTWHDQLGRVDLLFLCAPLTAETAGIIDARSLSQLGPNACLINVARGRLVDHGALIGRLEGGRLGGAALDVVDGMSEAERSRLARLPNVIITPKTASFIPGRQERFEQFVESQVARFLDGQPLLHRVEYPNANPPAF